ncbi:hypothetical protein B0H13DRAFT_1547624, partial [Mycena leptocephala]
GGDEKEKDKARNLMRKMVNSMSAKMEIGSPMASMYLLGHKDHYTSHKYKPFPWRSYVTFIRSFWLTELNTEKPEDNELGDSVPIGRQDGKFVATSGVDDYRYRPMVYSNVSLYEWIQCYDKKARNKRERLAFEEELRCARYADEREAIGKPREDMRHSFLPNHELFHSHAVWCDFRNVYKVIPNFIGGAIPRADRGDRNYYCLTI